MRSDPTALYEAVREASIRLRETRSMLLGPKAVISGDLRTALQDFETALTAAVANAGRQDAITQSDQWYVTGCVDALDLLSEGADSRTRTAVGHLLEPFR